MSTNPLDKEFDMNDEDDEIPEFIIPEGKEERDLDLIIDFALKAYKQQMDDMMLIEPKNRLKYFEIAERFLNTAKDARYKRDYLILKRDFMSKKPAPSILPNEPAVAEEKPKTVSRAELYAINKGKV